MENLPEELPKRYSLRFRGSQCLNCGHPLELTDRFCPHCSQANTTKKLSVRDFLEEFFSSIFTYDSKLFRTLSAMILRPGTISLDYVNGKRIRYTNPFRFLLSLAIVYFFLVNYSGHFEDINQYGMDGEDGPDSYKVGMLNLQLNPEARAQTIHMLDSLENSATGDSLKLSDLGEKFRKATENNDSIMLADPAAYYKTLGEGPFFKKMHNKREFFTKLLQHKKITSFKDAVEKYGVEEHYSDTMAFSLAQSTVGIIQRPGSYLQYMVSKLPFFIFFFLPLFTLFIWLVYVRKKYNYADHLIFSFHNTSLLFILLVLNYIVDTILHGTTTQYFLLAFGIYLLLAMRKFYAQGWFKTVVKFMLLNFIFFILAGFSIALFVAGSALTYS